MNTKIIEAAHSVPQGVSRKGIPFWKVMALGISAMQIGPNMALSGGYQLSYSGLGSWLVLLVAAGIAMILAMVLSRFARKYSVSATMLSVAQKLLPRFPVAVVAASLLLGYLLAPAVSVLGSAIYLFSLFNSFSFFQADPVLMTCLISAGVTLLIGWCAYVGVELSAKVSIVFGAICIPLAICITFAAGRSYGFDVGEQLSVETPVNVELFRGVFVAMAFFIGFDCVGAIANESANPARDIPRVLYLTVGVAALAIVGGALLQVPVLIAHPTEMANGESPTKILGAAGGFPDFSIATDIILTLTIISGLISWVSGAALTVATAAREGFLPKYFGHLNEKTKVPRRAICLLTVVSLVIPTMVFWFGRETPLNATLYLTNFLVLLWMIPYSVICFAVFNERSNGAANFLVRGIAALAMTLIILAVVAQLFWPIDAFSGIVNAIGVSAIVALSLVFYNYRRKILRP
jgi:amino acid transporter